MKGDIAVDRDLWNADAKYAKSLIVEQEGRREREKEQEAGAVTHRQRSSRRLRERRFASSGAVTESQRPRRAPRTRS
jgi:hypothetical protein